MSETKTGTERGPTVKGDPKAIKAAIGCAIVLMVGFGSCSIINAAAPSITAGINATLLEYSVGPMLATLTAFIGSLVGAKVIDVITPRRCLLLGTFCVTAVMVIASAATAPWMWYAANILNGVVLAIGAQAAAAGVVAEYYGDRAPSVFGVVIGVMAFLVAGEVLVESMLLAVMDYRQVFLVFAALSLCLGLFANLVLIGRVPRGAKAAAGADIETPEGAGSGPGVTLKEALKTPVLYLFFLAMFIAAFPYQGYSAYAAYYFTAGGLDASLSASLLSGFALFTAVFSLASGALARKFGASLVSVVVFVGFSCGIGLMLLWGANGGVPTLLISVVLCSLIGLVQALPALFIPQIFGMRDYTAINAVGMAGMHGGSTILFIVIAVVMEAFGYDAGFLMLAGCALASMVLFITGVVFGPMRRPEKRSTDARAATAENEGFCLSNT